MHNLFAKNELLAQLYKLLELLDNFDDKEIISKMIKNQFPKKSKYNFSAEEMSSLTNKEIGCHAWGVRKCNQFALDYIENMYNIKYDDDFKYNEYNYDLYDQFELVDRLSRDFQITRALIYRKTPIELLQESANAFDLYITQLFIEAYEKIIKKQ